MKKILSAAFAILVLAIPALPQYYDNGPTNGSTDAWTINFGFIVSDTFTFNSPGSVYLLNFEAWLFPGDVLQSVEVSITSSEFGGTTYYDGIVNFSASGCTTNQYGFNLCLESGVLNGAYLDAGTYWLNLQNAVVNTGDPVYWDENSGPSRASQSSVGTIPSESFTISNGCYSGKSGPDCGPPPPTSPEPGSLWLFGSSVLAAIIAARRRFRL